ncbi:MAG: hypothetical protein H6573_25040 [Lewinellaceae bacterium]|nr:hypothetical protein [Phaeodactylibacter sp.]MCB9350746.1 hypothetical protein [Lewinellaceae bacterium]
MRIFTILLVVMLGPFGVVAQAPLDALEGGIFFGISNYQGDFTLNTSPELRESNLAIGVVARHPLSYTHALRANLIYGKLSGNDRNFDVRERRGSSFQSSLVELSVVGEWEPFGENRTDLTLDLGQRLSPFFYAGLGMALINPEPVFGNVAEEKAMEDINADYSKVQFSIPMGLGLRLGINDLMSLSLDLGMRKTFTDYLDGVSVAGEKATHDWYLFGGVMFLYRIRK